MSSDYEMSNLSARAESNRIEKEYHMLWDS